MNSLLHDNVNEGSPIAQMDEALPNLFTFFDRIFYSRGGEDRIKFCELLIETEAIVAGGCVLNAHNPLGNINKYRGDIDIYVPVKNLTRFLNRLTLSPDSIMPFHLSRYYYGGLKDFATSYKSTCYCESFLRRNGIQKVYNFILAAEGGDPSLGIKIDVMAVRNRRTPIQVAQNFDLTFCQTWFDGTHIYATHPNDIRTKKGTLQGDYVLLFIQGNKFLKHRLEKYGERGYTISMQLNEPDIGRFMKNKCLKRASKLL